MTVNAISEIKDKRIYDNFYNSCMAEKTPDFTYDEMSIYCSCTAKKVMKNFTVQELMMLEGKIIAADESEQMKVVAANEKFMKAVSFCLSKIIK
ncbi:hypothetical protein N9A53_05690 [Candidatus Pelagibacter ubique]|nr:hypothetical protein [Candidatus Pelagibacter ubique]